MLIPMFKSETYNVHRMYIINIKAANKFIHLEGGFSDNIFFGLTAFDILEIFLILLNIWQYPNIDPGAQSTRIAVLL